MERLCGGAALPGVLRHHRQRGGDPGPLLCALITGGASILVGARHVADAAGLAAGSDRRAYLAHMDTRTRADVLAEAERRRDQGVLFAHRQLVEWRRSAGARARSIPQSLHQFNDR